MAKKFNRTVNYEERLMSLLDREDLILSIKERGCSIGATPITAPEYWNRFRKYFHEELNDPPKMVPRSTLNEKYSELSLTWEHLSETESAALLSFFRAHAESSFE